MQTFGIARLITSHLRPHPTPNSGSRAKGEVGQCVKRTAKWFDHAAETEEAITSISYPATPLGCMGIVVSDTPKKRVNFFSGFPFTAVGVKKRLRISEIKDSGNEVEGELFCEMVDDGAMIGFFDSHFFVNRDKYKVGAELDFELAGLIYEAHCTNDETITITDQATLEERYEVWSVKPERLPDGTLPPEIFHLAGMTGLVPNDKYTDDAEFYCVIDKISEFSLEGIRIFQMTPRLEDGEGGKAPLPGVIYGAATNFKNGYVPKAGDSIGGMMWVQGFLSESANK